MVAVGFWQVEAGVVAICATVPRIALKDRYLAQNVNSAEAKRNPGLKI